MTYGVRIQGAIGNLQIDSDRSIVGLRLVDSGTSSTITGTVANTFFNKIVAISYQPSAGGVVDLFINKATTPWTVVNYSGTAVSVDWAIISTFPNIPSTSGYGIQVFNADNDLSFDSKLVFQDGVSITDFATPLTFTGNPATDSAPFTPRLADYVIVNHSEWYPSATNRRTGYRFDNNTLNGIYHFSQSVGRTERYWTNFVVLIALKIGSV